MFLQALLRGGEARGHRLLREETVALMRRNQIGDLAAGILATTNPARSVDVDFFPGQRLGWGLATMINLEPGPDGRCAGSQTWAGVFNTHYWIDPARDIAGLVMTQVLPFGDARVMRAYGRFERVVYAALRTA